MYTIPGQKSRHPGNRLPTSGPKKRRKMSNSNAKKPANICSDILLSVVFRFVSRYDIHMKEYASHGYGTSVTVRDFSHSVRDFETLYP